MTDDSGTPRDGANRPGASGVAPDPDEPGTPGTPAAGAPRDGDPDRPYGTLGRPLGRNGPFYVGFVGALGVLIAWWLLQLLAGLSQVLTLIGVAAFIAIGLDPLVRTLQRRGLGRGSSVAVVFVAVVAAVAGFVAAVLPSLVSQVTEFSQSLPDTVDGLLQSDVVRRLDEEYGVVTRISDQIRERLSQGETITSLFGGVVGAGRAILSGFASVFTVLVLTLYFLASLPSITDAGYRLVPRSRRPRVRLLGDEIIRRIGGYVAGQTAVAAINGVLTFVVISIAGLPYAAVLAIAVALFGLIPLIGATIGAVLVVLVALTQSWQVALGLAIYYVIYQQVENYVIAPRIMSRTVEVPGAVAVIAALAGGSLLGVLGALIAIPIAAAILLIIQQVVLPRQDQI